MKQAKKAGTRKSGPRSWDNLDEVIRETPGSSDRAAERWPSVSGIQAFEPILIEGQGDPASPALRLLGLQRRFSDGDKDGRSSVPLSLEAQGSRRAC